MRVHERVYLIFREIIKESVLEGLKVTSQIKAHVDILIRSVLIQLAGVVRSATITKKIIWKFETILFSISLIYNKKERGL